MIILSGQQSGGAKILNDYKKHGIGRMMVDCQFVPFKKEKWGLDNGAFIVWQQEKPFPTDQFLRMVDWAMEMVSLNHPPYLAVCPDIVAGGNSSIEFSMKWIEQLPKEIPWYLAVQDKMDSELVIEVLPRFSGIFLGGTDPFKWVLGDFWQKIAAHFQLPFHYGRAGTKKKIFHAIELKADSLDSTFPLWTKERWSKFLKHIKGE